ncbi:SRPBCC family protein [Labilithrix luteola]|nr:SRPBCC domain-containing protein [Labilithrix luteola]
MVDILHKVGVEAPSPDRVYDALSTIDGLAGWWTTDTRGRSSVDGVIKFTFDSGFVDMKVLELQPGKRVLWLAVDGPEEWVGTKISFDLKQDGDYATVLFKHQGWREPTEFMHHCSTKWAAFLMSLKSLVETGKGAPHPNDIHVINSKH